LYGRLELSKRFTRSSSRACAVAADPRSSGVEDMSSDFLLAIKANRDTCTPYTGPGWVGHVVRVSMDTPMTIVDEFTDGGSFEHADCAPASLQSWFLDKTDVRTDIRTIERLAGTDLNGTGFTGLIVAGRHFGFQIKFSPDDPPPGHIMNPGGFSELVGIAEFPAYLAASQGGCLVLPNTGPTLDAMEDEDMKPILARTDRPAGVTPDPHGPGAIYLVANWPYGPKRWISSPEFLDSYRAICGDPVPVDPFVLDRCEEQPPIAATFVMKP
jgi:hypothetical protein